MKSVRPLLLLMTMASPVFAEAAGEATKSPFNIPGGSRQWAPSREFHQEHISLDVRPDLAKGEVAVSTRLRLVMLVDSVSEFSLDADGIEVVGVRVNGVVASWVIRGTKLVISVGRKITYHEKLLVTVDSRARKSEGFVFSAPATGGESWEFYSNGEVGSNAKWFPAYHQPDDRCTFDVTITVPNGMTAISNGNRISSKRMGSTTVVSYRMQQPIPTYLFAVAGGNFKHVSDGTAKVSGRVVKIGHWAPADKMAWSGDNLQNTARLMEIFSAKTGVAFPWDHYDVVMLRGMKGGMEYPTCTFMGEANFYPMGGHSDVWPMFEAIFPHELAHSWFGDWVTNKTWGEGWLNEGFPCYLAAYAIGELHGQDMFEWALWSNQEGYMKEDASSYRRPLSTAYWPNADATLDAHTYYGGAARVHMLRHWLGEDRFWASIKTYLQKHGNGSVQSEDLRSSIQEATGQSMDQWFASWVYGAGYPEIETDERYDVDAKKWIATIKQVQPAGRGTADVFVFPLDIKLVFRAGARTKRVWVNSRSTSVAIDTDEPPIYVVIDDGQNIPKIIHRNRPIQEVKAQALDGRLANRLAAILEAGERMESDEFIAIAGNGMTAESIEDVRIWLMKRIAAKGEIGVSYLKAKVDTLSLSGRQLEAARRLIAPINRREASQN